MNSIKSRSAIPLAFILIILLGSFTFLIDVSGSAANAEITNASDESEVTWLSGWSYRQQHIIEGSTAGAQTNYQMKIVLHQGLGTNYNDNTKTPPEGHAYLGELPGEDLSQWQLSVDSSIHENYGLTYPLTYVFNVPTAVTSIKVYYRFLPEQNWTQLPEKTENDFFNGINAARFDSSNHKAYISIAFSALSDKVYLYFTDTSDEPIEVEFVETAKYYDNRKAVVVATADDWSQYYNDYFKNASEIFRNRNLWLTVAIISGAAPWADIQSELDAGYIEPAAHSYDHPDVVPYQDYDLQIGASKQQIIGNLTLPLLNRKGLKEYVWAWIEPSGQSDETCRSKLGEYLYLCNRNTTKPEDIFANWDSTNQLYQPICGSIWGDSSTTEQLNSKFDQVYNFGGIYHFMIHPWNVSLAGLIPHLDYIKERKDVWYAGFGHLYVYHFAQERNLVSASPLGKSKARADFGDIRFADQDGTTLLDYWIEEMVVGNYAVFWVEVPSIPAAPSSTSIYVYYGRTVATTTSDADATFLFFDHFEGSHLDIFKWAGPDSVEYSIGDSYLTVTDVNGSNNRGFWARGYAPLQSGFAVECRNVYYENVVNGSIEFLANFVNAEWQWPPVVYAGYGDYWAANESTATFQAGIDSESYRTGWSDVLSPSTHDFEIQKDQNGNTYIYIDGQLVLGPVVSSVPFFHFLFTVYKMPDLASSKAAVDAVIIRKYCNPEPLHGNWSGVTAQPNNEYAFSVLSNSTISALKFDSTTLELSFTASGPSGTTGYSQVTIAKTIAADITNLNVYLDGEPVVSSVASTTDTWIISFTYTHSTHRVVVALDDSLKEPQVNLAVVLCAVVMSFVVLLAFSLVMARRTTARKGQSMPRRDTSF